MFARGIVHNFRRIIFAFVIIRQRGDGPQFAQHASARIVVEAGDTSTYFVQYEYKFSRRMNYEVPWSGPGISFAKCKIIGRERALARVKSVNQQFVEPKISG